MTETLWIAVILLAIIAFAGADFTTLGLLGGLLFIGATKKDH